MKNVVGNIYEGEIVSKDVNSYLVDLGIGFDAILNKDETNVELEVGDFVDVIVTYFVKDDYYVSMKGVLRKKRLEEFEPLINSETPVSGKVISYRNNRFTIDLKDNIKGSVYVKNMDTRFIEDGTPYVGKEYEFLIIGRNNRGFEDFDLTRRPLIIKEMETKKEEFKTKFNLEQVVSGVVSDANNSGVILEIDGYKMFVPRSEIAHQKQNVLPQKGEEFSAVIQELQERNLSLKGSIKALIEHPFTKASHLVAGDIIKGKIARKLEYGMFVELFENVDGLVHISEVSYEHTKNLDSFEIGQEVEVKVLNVDNDKKKIALSIKRLNPSPFDHLKEKTKVGDTISVLIKRITENGIRVMVMDNYYTSIINEDIHDFSQIKPTLRINDRLEVVVMSIDETNEKIELSNVEYVNAQYEIFNEGL